MQRHSDKSRKWRFGWIAQLAVSVTLIGILVSYAPPVEWIDVLSNLNWGWVVISVLVAITIVGFEVGRTELLLPGLRSHRLSNLYINYKAAFVAQLPAGPLGSDFYRVVAYRNVGLRPVTSFPMIFVARVLGLIAVIVVGLLSAMVIITTTDRFQFFEETENILLGVGLSLMVSILVSFFLTRKILTSSISSLSWIKNLLLNVRQISLKSFVVVAFVSIFIVLFKAVGLFLIAISMSVSTSFLAILAALSLGMLLAVIPIAASGIGLREAGSVAVLSMLGLETGTVVVMMFLYRACVLAGVIIGLIVLGTLFEGRLANANMKLHD